MLKIGDKAPAFKLFNTDKQEVSLESLKGKKVVVLFFPFAFTGVCTAELCGVRDDISNYSKLDAEVVAVSVDSPFVLMKFKELEHYPFQLLSDFNKEAVSAYGCMYDTFALGTKGVAKRSAFVIDKEGVIQYAEVLEVASEVPNLTKVKEVLATLT